MSGLHIAFATTEFEDDAAARAARVNATIGGAALAVWLAGALRSAGFEIGGPWVEDHGWDFAVTAAGKTYLCVCSIEEDGSPPREAHVTVSCKRSLWDRLKGAGKIGAEDPVVAAVRGIVERRVGADKVQLDWFA